MAITRFIPTVWSTRLLFHLNKSLVYGALANREYEGEIKDIGDRVKVSQISGVTISTYSKNTNISAPETLSDAGVDLIIDQGDYFNFAVDDIDTAQSKPKFMDDAMSVASYGLADKVDQYVASLHSGVHADNIVGLGNDTTPVTPTKSDIYSYFVTAGQRMDEANVPRIGRWAVVSPKHYALLLQAPEFVRSTGLGDSVVQTGTVGSIAGFAISVSNNVPNTAGAKYKTVFGCPKSYSLAIQVVKTEAYRPELRFADGLKGLQVYGAKLMNSKAIAVGTWS